HGGAAARSQDQDTERSSRPGFDLHAHRVEHRAAHAESLPAEKRGADLRRREARRHQGRSEEHTSELQSRSDLVCRLLPEKKKDGDKKASTWCRTPRHTDKYSQPGINIH